VGGGVELRVVCVTARVTVGCGATHTVVSLYLSVFDALQAMPAAAGISLFAAAVSKSLLVFADVAAAFTAEVSSCAVRDRDFDAMV
jgi:hypothetical protein